MVHTPNSCRWWSWTDKKKGTNTKKEEEKENSGLNATNGSFIRRAMSCLHDIGVNGTIYNILCLLKYILPYQHNLSNWAFIGNRIKYHGKDIHFLISHRANNHLCFHTNNVLNILCISRIMPTALNLSSHKEVPISFEMAVL